MESNVLNGYPIWQYIIVPATLLTALVAGSAYAEAKVDLWPAIRAHAESKCGSQLARLLEVNKSLVNPWVSNRAVPMPPETMDRPWVLPLFAYYANSFVLIQENSYAGGRTDRLTTEQRTRLINGLEAALALDNCLTPTDQELASAAADRDSSSIDEVMAPKCVVPSSLALVEVLKGDLVGAALQARVDEIKAQQTLACKRKN